jgi:ankyrin repeat protein
MSYVDIHSHIWRNAKKFEKEIEILKSLPENAKVKDHDGNLPLHKAMIVRGIGVFDLVEV